MDSDEPLFPQQQKTKNVNRDDPGGVEDLILATRDHAVIREWARVLCAEPATGVESPSGPATSMKVADGGSVLRFNFPGIGRFREISWTEWFDQFNRLDLTFVFENPGARTPPSARYRLIPTAELKT